MRFELLGNYKKESQLVVLVSYSLERKLHVAVCRRESEDFFWHM